MTAARETCTACSYGVRCEAHRQRRVNPGSGPKSQTSKVTLHLVGKLVTDLLETHRWTRKIERSGSSREIRCLDCGAVVIWAPKETLEPVVGKVALCPGRIIAESVPPPETLPPMGILAPEIPKTPRALYLEQRASGATSVPPVSEVKKRAVPCSAGHAAEAGPCDYCQPVTAKP